MLPKPLHIAELAKVDFSKLNSVKIIHPDAGELSGNHTSISSFLRKISASYVGAQLKEVVVSTFNLQLDLNYLILSDTYICLIVANSEDGCFIYSRDVYKTSLYNPGMQNPATGLKELGDKAKATKAQIDTLDNAEEITDMKEITRKNKLKEESKIQERKSICASCKYYDKDNSACKFYTPSKPVTIKSLRNAPSCPDGRW